MHACVHESVWLAPKAVFRKSQVTTHTARRVASWPIHRGLVAHKPGLSANVAHSGQVLQEYFAAGLPMQAPCIFHRNIVALLQERYHEEGLRSSSDDDRCAVTGVSAYSR